MNLTPIETRVLGALIEKDITTPDYYPLSLNALVNACNQKNNRDPLMTLDEAAVRGALATLQERRMAGPAGGADSRVTKYEHRLQEVFNFDRREEQPGSASTGWRGNLERVQESLGARSVLAVATENAEDVLPLSD